MGLLNLEKGKEQDNGGKRKLEWGRLNLKITVGVFYF